MVFFLRKNKYDHIVLYHDPIVKAVVNDLFSVDKSINGKTNLKLIRADNVEVSQFIK